MARQSTRGYWLLWAILSLALGTYLGYALLSVKPGSGNAVSIFLPGQTSAGHHQIELACAACHTDPMGGGAVLQEACVKCHGAELKAADDSHPKSKFTDPRNAESLAKVDARACVSCHIEHRPEITQAMGVTLPEDFCFHCHAEVAEERPSHTGMAFTSCATGGCHNFHDNRALYEDFLTKHLNEADILSPAQTRTRDLLAGIAALPDYPLDRYPLEPLSEAANDAPAEVSFDPRILKDWEASGHAQAGVNCSACHQSGANAQWEARPGIASCQACHATEVKGLGEGKHGMREAAGLSPMTPAQARLPMKHERRNESLSCTSCHDDHRFETRRAAVQACLSCHDDTHSRNYQGSAHYALWLRELNANADPGTGVSCATCHMPRLEHRASAELGYIVVEHNQNAHLRPNEKMIRPVCMSCHGLGFSIDALADKTLIESNFKGRPARHIESLDMAEHEFLKHQEKKRRDEP